MTARPLQRTGFQCALAGVCRTVVEINRALTGFGMGLEQEQCGGKAKRSQCQSDPSPACVAFSHDKHPFP